MIQITEKEDSRIIQYIDQFNDTIQSLDMIIKTSSDLDLINSMVRASAHLKQSVQRLEQSENTAAFL